MKIPKIRQLPSGNWFCQLRIGGRSIPITEDTEDLCAAKAMAYKTGLLKVKKHPEDMTVRQSCTQYIEAKRAQLSPTTIQSYEKITRNAFPDLMTKKLSALSKQILQRSVDAECGRISRVGKKYAPKTIVSNYMFVVSAVHYIDPDMDMTVKLPEIKQHPVFILTPEEVYSAVKGSPIELPVLLAMWLSFSMSEIRGLTKSKSIRDGKITVAETVVDVNGKPVRKEEDKEEKRARTLDIPPYIQTLIDKVDGDVLVPLSGAAIYKRFSRALDKAGLPHISFHKLRHVNASVMADLNIPDNIANDRGGWKTSYTRQRVYTHTFPESRRAADKQIDSLFENIIANENANDFK